MRLDVHSPLPHVSKRRAARAQPETSGFLHVSLVLLLVQAFLAPHPSIFGAHMEFSVAHSRQFFVLLSLTKCSKKAGWFHPFHGPGVPDFCPHIVCPFRLQPPR